MSDIKNFLKGTFLGGLVGGVPGALIGGGIGLVAAFIAYELTKYKNTMDPNKLKEIIKQVTKVIKEDKEIQKEVNEAASEAGLVTKQNFSTIASKAGLVTKEDIEAMENRLNANMFTKTGNILETLALSAVEKSIQSEGKDYHLFRSIVLYKGKKQDKQLDYVAVINNTKEGKKLITVEIKTRLQHSYFPGKNMLTKKWFAEKLQQMKEQTEQFNKQLKELYEDKEVPYTEETLPNVSKLLKDIKNYEYWLIFYAYGQVNRSMAKDKLKDLQHTKVKFRLFKIETDAYDLIEITPNK